MERGREREQSLCPLTQRVCLSASVADGASECAITTLMTDISLTLESVCMEKSRGGGEGCAERERQKTTIHLMPTHSIMTQSLLHLLVGNTWWCRKQL